MTCPLSSPNSPRLGPQACQKRVKIVSLHEKIGPPAKALPPVPQKPTKKKQQDDEDDEENEEDCEEDEDGNRRKKGAGHGVVHDGGLMGSTRCHTAVTH